jgi:hypothetical protein
MWNLHPNDRLHEWKEFRIQIGNLSLEDAVTKTSHLWSYAPYVTHYLDSNQKETWPDPWTLLHENYYCDLAKSLGMLYTLYLCDHYNNSIEKLELKIFKNPMNHDVINTVWVNEGKYILNSEFDTVVNNTLVDENLVLTHDLSIEDLHLNLY